MIFLAVVAIAFICGAGAGYHYGMSECARQRAALTEQLTYWARIAGSGKTPPPVPQEGK